MTRIGIFGGEGRMGRAIAALIPECGAALAGAVDMAGGGRALAEASDVLVDFSIPAAIPEHLEAATAARTPLVIGTTGLSDAHHAAIDEAARRIPVLQAANTSLGVNLLAHLVADAARRLADWDIEIVEMHHRHKVDAPSGTALLLGTAAAEGRGKSMADLARHDPAGARPEGSIGFASLRGGSVAGDHQVILATEGERLELGHRAESREIFARGAIRAALWLADQPPGRYAMDDMLGLA